jgi:hypothetical protein
MCASVEKLLCFTSRSARRLYDHAASSQRPCQSQHAQNQWLDWVGPIRRASPRNHTPRGQSTFNSTASDVATSRHISLPQGRVKRRPAFPRQRVQTARGTRLLRRKPARRSQLADGRTQLRSVRPAADVPEPGAPAAPARRAAPPLPGNRPRSSHARRSASHPGTRAVRRSAMR